MTEPETAEGPLSFEINFPKEPELTGPHRDRLPLVEPWYAQYIRKDDKEEYHTSLSPLIGWEMDAEGNRRGIRAPLSEPGEGFKFAGYVRGRQIADLVPSAEPGPDGQQQMQAMTFEQMFDRMTAHRIQQNRIAMEPAQEPRLGQENA